MRSGPLRALAPLILAVAAPLAASAGTPASAPAPGSATASAPAAPAAVKLDIPFEKYVLPNGLTVILHEDHRTPIVAVNVWYHVGSKDEPPGRNGFAHLFEHLMFQGSRHVGEDQFFQLLERAGASDRNGTTNGDRTNYFETVPKNQLELALWLESDRMAFLLDHVDQATFESQREVVKNERRQNYENAPYGLVWQFLAEAMYPPEHPYHRLTIGTPADLDAATLDDVRAFYRTYYRPNDATLVLAGDFDAAHAKELVARYFGPIVRGPEAPVKRHAMPVELAGPKTLKIEAGVELPRIVVAWHAPPAFAPGEAELALLGEVLSTGKSSRLYKRLVYDMQIAQSVGAGVDPRQLGSEFEITVTLKKGQSTEKALAAIDDELAKARAFPPTPDEMTRARASLVSQLVFDAEPIGQLANQLNYYDQFTRDPAYASRRLARLESATPLEVQIATAGWLRPERRVVAVVEPNPDAPKAGRLVEVR